MRNVIINKHLKWNKSTKKQCYDKIGFHRDKPYFRQNYQTHKYAISDGAPTLVIPETIFMPPTPASTSLGHELNLSCNEESIWKETHFQNPDVKDNLSPCMSSDQVQSSLPVNDIASNSSLSNLIAPQSSTGDIPEFWKMSDQRHVMDNTSDTRIWNQTTDGFLDTADNKNNFQIVSDTHSIEKLIWGNGGGSDNLSPPRKIKLKRKTLKKKEENEVEIIDTDNVIQVDVDPNSILAQETEEQPTNASPPALVVDGNNARNSPPTLGADENTADDDVDDPPPLLINEANANTPLIPASTPNIMAEAERKHDESSNIMKNPGKFSASFDMSPVPNSYTLNIKRKKVEAAVKPDQLPVLSGTTTSGRTWYVTPTSNIQPLNTHVDPKPSTSGVNKKRVILPRIETANDSPTPSLTPSLTPSGQGRVRTEDTPLTPVGLVHIKPALYDYCTESKLVSSKQG